MNITVQRLRKTNDGIFGILTIDTDKFTCFTVENKDKAIPVGIYTLNFTWSGKFGKTMPHIVVPERDKMAEGDAGIRIHPANYASELGGCIAVGNSENIDAIWNSKETFNNLLNIIMGRSDVSIEVKEI